MAQVQITGDVLRVVLTGLDKVLAFKGSLEVPLAHVRSVKVDPEAGAGALHGVRFPGTNVPGLITAGSFREEGEWSFFDVHDPEKVVVIELDDHEHYRRLVIEVPDPDQVAKTINEALAR
jgi:hypothetical protein